MTQGARSVRSRYPLGILVIVALTVVRCLSIVTALFKIQGGDLAQWLRDTVAASRRPGRHGGST